MKNMNLIAVFDPSGQKILMCRRRKEPYKGMYNLVGGHIDPGESSEDAAYRELFEETGIARKNISLTHYADYEYHTWQIRLEWYVGQLKENQAVSGEENELEWIGLDENFFDMTRFAGQGNIGHILEEIRLEGLIVRKEA